MTVELEEAKQQLSHICGHYQAAREAYAEAKERYKLLREQRRQVADRYLAFLSSAPDALVCREALVLFHDTNTAFEEVAKAEQEAFFEEGDKREALEHLEGRLVSALKKLAEMSLDVPAAGAVRAQGMNS